MSLESEIKNLTGAMTRLAEGVEKLLSLGHAPQSEKQQWLDSAPGTAAPASVTLRNDEVLPGGMHKDAQFVPLKATPAELTKGYGGTAQHTAAALTLEDIKKALMATAAKFDAVTGTAKSKAILQRFGAQKLSQVAADNYAEFIALCETVAAGGEV